MPRFSKYLPWFFFVALLFSVIAWIFRVQHWPSWISTPSFIATVGICLFAFDAQLELSRIAKWISASSLASWRFLMLATILPLDRIWLSLAIPYANSIWNAVCIAVWISYLLYRKRLRKRLQKEEQPDFDFMRSNTPTNE